MEGFTKNDTRTPIIWSGFWPSPQLRRVIYEAAIGFMAEKMELS